MYKPFNDVIWIKWKTSFDKRGDFKKLLSKELLKNFKTSEIFISKSKKNVIRGMHYQKYPFEHDKIVTCLSGSILDVIVDLRHGSKTFGKYKKINLSADLNKSIFVPKGFAHGFLALEESTVLYATNSPYSEKNDVGIKWDSFGFSWPIKKPIVSDRDLNLPALKL